jgi:undecaprenyl diphosphate synthase
MYERPLTPEKAGLDPRRLPTHVAIIMDGNGRWASSQGKNRLEGHYQGYHALKETVYACDDLGIQFLTVYAFSSENWRRSQDEVGGLMTLMLYAMQAEIEELIENKIRVRVSGRMSDLPEDLRTEFMAAAERTVDFSGLTFNIAINYGGRGEVVDAVKALAHAVQQGEITPDSIDEDAIAAHLYTPDIPDPDLLIRTAGEMRLSNFLLWQTAYSEIYVTPTCWPAFDSAELVAALANYARRVRKFGTVVENPPDA